MDLVARLSLQDDMSGRLRNVTRSLGNVERSTRTVSSGFSGLTKTMAGVAGAIGVTALLSKGMSTLKSSISSAFDRIDTMERFDRVMTSMTGSSEEAKKALDSINEAVTGTAYGLDVAAKGVQNFVTRGMSVEKSVKTVEAFGDAVAFYGEGSNEQLSSVMDALSKMTSSGKVQMDQMNRLYDAGILGPEMYAKAVGRDLASVKKDLSSGKIGAEEFIDVVGTAMMEGTNGVQNIAGAAREAGASWDAAMANMKAAVVRGVTTIIQTIDEMLAENGLPSMRDMIASFGKSAEKSLKKVAGFVSPVIGGFIKMAWALKPIAPLIESVAIAIGIAVAAVAGFYAVLGLFKLIGVAIAFLFSPIGLVIGGIAALVLGFQAAYKHSEPFRNAIDGVVGAVKALYEIITGGNSGKVMDIMQKAGLSTDQIRNVYAFADGVKGAIDKVKSYIGGVASAVKTGDTGGILGALGFSPEAVGHITGFIDNVKTNIADLTTFLAEKWAEIKPGFETILGAFSTGGEVIGNIFTTLLSVLSPIFDALVVAFKIIADVATIVFTNVIAPAVEFTMTMFSLLWKVVGPILELLGAAIGVAFGILKVVWDTILKPVAEWLMGTFVTAFEAAKPYIEDLGTAFDNIGGFISGVTDHLKTFSKFLKDIKIPAWVTEIGGKIAGAASWVGNAISGGGSKSNYHGIDYVPYDGYQTTLHKGERVQTAQEVREGGKGGGFGGGGVTISGNTFNVRQESDIQSIAYELSKLIEREASQT